MKRTALAVSFTLLLAASLLAAGYTPPSHSSGSSQHCYVLVEITGTDASANIYATQQDVKNRQEQVNADNMAKAKDNKVLDAEISKLSGQLATKAAKLAAAKDETAKADLQKEVDDLKAQIAQKKSEKKPYVRTLDPKQFSTRADADKYIEQVLKDAQAAKEKAELKEADAKKK